MKILMIMRMYSHLVPTVESEKWVPYGMPAFTKLVEGLNADNISTEILLLSRLPDGLLREAKRIQFKKLKNIWFNVFPFRGWWKDWWAIRKELKKNKYDLVYIDRSHAVFGGILALLGYKVVLRLHGVANLYELPFWRKGCIPSVELMSFGAPFKYVICSQDGSPGKSFTDKYLRKSVPREILLNGADQFKINKTVDLRKQFNIQPQTKIVLSSGRMDSSKSMDVFLDSLIAMIKEGEDIFGFLVGGGEQLEDFKETVSNAGCADKIILTGQVPHQQMNEYLSCADIFVSLNLYGNLSNCVLEAMSAGKCIVTLAPCQQTFRDEQNDREDMRQALLLINRDNMQEELTAILKKLTTNPEIISEKSGAIRNFSATNILSWAKRIDKEIGILKKVGQAKD